MTSAQQRILVRITWALFMICVRMLTVVARTVWRLPVSSWIKGAVLAGFVLLFFYRPAIAYYWFWASFWIEMSVALYSVLFGKTDSLRAWLKR